MVAGMKIHKSHNEALVPNPIWIVQKENNGLPFVSASMHENKSCDSLGGGKHGWLKITKQVKQLLWEGETLFSQTKNK